VGAGNQETIIRWSATCNWPRSSLKSTRRLGSEVDDDHDYGEAACGLRLCEIFGRSLEKETGSLLRVPSYPLEKACDNLGVTWKSRPRDDTCNF
jgi:hypothetical protein